MNGPAPEPPDACNSVPIANITTRRGARFVGVIATVAGRVASLSFRIRGAMPCATAIACAEVERVGFPLMSDARSAR